MPRLRMSQIQAAAPIASSARELGFRCAVLLVGLCLAATGGWFLAVEMLRPEPGPFPASRTEVAAAAERLEAAQRAAEVGWIDGELWAGLAVSAWADEEVRPGGSRPAADIDALCAAAGEAVRLSPDVARGWFTLAVCKERKGNGVAAAAALKMAYFTAPRSDRMFLPRLRLATRPELFHDPEIQSLVDADVRTALVRGAFLKPMVQEAYKSAAPEAKALIEKIAQSIDADFASRLRN